jgi:hypothetical protein
VGAFTRLAAVFMDEPVQTPKNRDTRTGFLLDADD